MVWTRVPSVAVIVKVKLPPAVVVTVSGTSPVHCSLMAQRLRLENNWLRKAVRSKSQLPFQ